MDNNIKDMFDILLKLIDDRKKFKESTKELDDIDKDVTKFYFLVWRFMNLGVNNPGIQANLKLNPKSFITFFWISYNLEQVGDELKRIARKLEKTKEGKDYFKEVILSTKENYDKSMKAFFEKNKNLAKEVILKRDAMNKTYGKLSNIKGFEAISEKLQQINANIHNNSKIVFYGF